MDLLELRLDQVEVVEQPFGRRADVVAGGRLHADVAVRLAQREDVAAQARKEGRRARASPARRGASRPGCGRAARSAAARRSRSGSAAAPGRARRRGCRAAPRGAPGRQAQQLGMRHAPTAARSVVTPISSATATSVVTRRAATKPCMVSATQCSANRRPRDPWQVSRCSPRADSSIGDVSAASPNDAVLQDGWAMRSLFMKRSARTAWVPSGKMLGCGARSGLCACGRSPGNAVFRVRATQRRDSTGHCRLHDPRGPSDAPPTPCRTAPTAPRRAASGPASAPVGRLLRPVCPLPDGAMRAAAGPSLHAEPACRGPQWERVHGQRFGMLRSRGVDLIGGALRWRRGEARAGRVPLRRHRLCSRHPSLDQQLCRWLLLSLDRLPGTNS